MVSSNTAVYRRGLLGLSSKFEEIEVTTTFSRSDLHSPRQQGMGKMIECHLTFLFNSLYHWVIVRKNCNAFCVAPEMQS